MLIRVIDFETTGMPPDAAICETGWCDLIVDRDAAGATRIEFGSRGAFLVDPGRPIPPEASAIHHIIDADVVCAPPPAVAYARLREGKPSIFIAHKADYEREFFPEEKACWGCTFKTALRIYPEAPSYSVQGLRYHLGLGDQYRAECLPPHRAGPDSFATALLLREMILTAGVTGRQLLDWMVEPALLPRVTFGKKHRGQKWDDVPSDYLDWLLTSEMGEDVKDTARFHLAQRAAAKAAETAAAAAVEPELPLLIL